MTNREAYNAWSDNYDEMINLTRDLELKSKKFHLKDLTYTSVLELGCGTGKNTCWLSQKANLVIAVDFSENMLDKAKASIKNNNVQFVQADIKGDWNFLQERVELVTCSLILEHIEFLAPVFEKAAAALVPGGYFYIGELHPYKQYAGSKARFANGEETIVLEAFTHHVSDYINPALQNNFQLVKMIEWFDEDENMKLPRILSLLLKKI